MSDDSLKLKDVIAICSRAKLADGSMSFNSFGTDDVRIDTMDFLYSIGKTLEDAEQIVNAIEEKDYVDGPCKHYDDNKKERYLWIFKKDGFGMKLYIKILPYNKNRYIAVVSFHEDR